MRVQNMKLLEVSYEDLSSADGRAVSVRLTWVQTIRYLTEPLVREKRVKGSIKGCGSRAWLADKKKTRGFEASRRGRKRVRVYEQKLNLLLRHTKAYLMYLPYCTHIMPRGFETVDRSYEITTPFTLHTSIPILANRSNFTLEVGKSPYYCTLVSKVLQIR